MTKLAILTDFYYDLRYLLVLREHSDPAETLEKVKERLAEARQSLRELDKHKKELTNEKESQKETE